MLSKRVRENLLKFVISYENPEGGFNYPHDTPASIEETYFAIMIFKQLDYRYDNPKTVEFLDGIALRRNSSLKHLYQLLASCIALNITKKIARIADLYFSIDPEKIAHLSDLYYYALLGSMLRQKPIISKKWQDYLREHLCVRFQHLSTCDRCLTICDVCGLQYDSSKLVSWVRASQNPDGGFGFYPGTTSYLENTWHALNCLRRLSASPASVDNCRDFIMSCASESGGFGRQRLALPTLEYSFMAIDCLQALDENLEKTKSEKRSR